MSVIPVAGKGFSSLWQPEKALGLGSTRHNSVEGALLGPRLTVVAKKDRKTGRYPETERRRYSRKEITKSGQTSKLIVLGRGGKAVGGRSLVALKIPLFVVWKLGHYRAWCLICQTYSDVLRHSKSTLSVILSSV